MTFKRSICWIAYGSACLAATTFLSCEDEIPDPSTIIGTRLTTGAHIWPPVAWSTDGTKIYATTGTWQQTGDLLEIDVDTKSTRTLAGPEVQHSIASTGEGVAYIQGSSAKELHLLSNDRDTVLAPDADWVTRTSGGEYLVYRNSSSYAIGVVEMASLVSREFAPPSGSVGGSRVSASSPDGSEIIFYSERRLPPSILTIASGTWRSIDFPNNWAYGALLGWTDSGVLVFAGGGLMDLLTGEVITDLPNHWDDQARFQNRVSGFVELTATVAAVWDEICLRDTPFVYCEWFRYRLTLHNLVSGRELIIAKATMEEHVSRERLDTTPYRNGSFSPDAQRVAFVIEGDLYVCSVPEGW